MLKQHDQNQKPTNVIQEKHGVQDIAIIRETLAELDQDDEEMTALDLEKHNFGNSFKTEAGEKAKSATINSGQKRTSVPNIDALKTPQS